MTARQPEISIVVPVLDDHAVLSRCLASLLPQADRGIEVVVADASPGPEARELCRHSRVEHVAVRPGRAAQMNRGARASRGEWLWFLHADTVVPDGAVAALRASRDRGGAVWGAFRQVIDHSSPLVRVIEAGANARARWARLPLGDQGIFVARRTFDAVGGFPDLPLLEDLELARRLGRLARPRILRPALVSDGRRWRELGVLRTTWRNWWILALHASGRRSPAELARLYHRGEGIPSGDGERTSS